MHGRTKVSIVQCVDIFCFIVLHICNYKWQHEYVIFFVVENKNKYYVLTIRDKSVSTMFYYLDHGQKRTYEHRTDEIRIKEKITMSEHTFDNVSELITNIEIVIVTTCS